MLIAVQDARALLSAITVNWGEETVSLTEAGTRVLAQDVIADRDQPPFNRVAMDGIAINYLAYAAGQRRFPIAWLQAAGDAPRALTDVTQCVEIMTGAALPAGVTTVVRYEDLERERDAFVLPEGVVDGKSIHQQGKDIIAGKLLASAGRLIGVAETGMLASCGYENVRVKKKPRVAVIATGNELVPVGSTPAPHQIRMSNVFQLQQLLEGVGATTATYHFPDDRAALLEHLETQLAHNDIVVLSGGVSKGKLDFVPGVLASLGVEKMFHGVAQRPGKPLWVGRREETLVFGLPGNPVSSVNCLVHYVLPFIRRQQGLEAKAACFAQITEALTFKPDLTLFQLVHLESSPEDGRLLATPTKNQGSGDGTSLLRAQGFMEIPRGQTTYPAGAVFKVVRY